MPRLKGSKIQKIKDNKNIESRNKLLIEYLKRYYNKNEELIKKINSIKNNKTSINIQFLKFFLNKYCKKHNIIINDIHLYSRYKILTKNYSRKQFSLTNSNTKIQIDENNDNKYPITFLNVFKWLYSNNIIEYIENNYIKILKEFELYKNGEKY
jgi:hypothetical protein